MQLKLYNLSANIYFIIFKKIIPSLKHQLEEFKMGAAKTIANMYTYNEYLYYYINGKNKKMVEQILEKRPNLIKDPLTSVSKVTALVQVAVTGNIEMAQLLIEKYNADPNLPTPRGQTPMIAAIKKNHIQMVQYLLSKGADPNYIDKIGFKTIQYAVLQGLYQISYILYPLIKDKQLRRAEEYYVIGKKYSYRYVDYDLMLQNLLKMIQPQKVPNFLIKKRIVLSDPVIDPRQSWKNWFLRNLQFKDPPLVQRASLPEQLRPQNRRFGRVSTFFGRLTMTQNAQKPEYKPSTQSEYGGAKNRSRMAQIQSQQLQMNSIA